MEEFKEETTVSDERGKKKKEKPSSVVLDKSPKKVSMAFLTIGLAIMLAQWIAGLNLVAIVGALYMCITAAVITIGILKNKRVYLWMLVGYLCVSFGIATYYVFNGADAGWGAIMSGQAGYDSAEHALWQGAGNFGTRLLGNIIIASPSFLLLVGIMILVDRWKTGKKIKTAIAASLSVLLVGTSVFFVFSMNLRSNPKAFDMSAGHDEYLGKIKNNAKDNKSPNVLFVFMDDMGYGDSSYNARKAGLTPAFQTPNIDSIAEEGVDFDNFYSNYSVCSPSRFATMTGRYPYRGYADNVMYPTVNTLIPCATTRVFNAIEMGNNCDGMLGDEVTMAEMLRAAGYATGAFGKWHLGDFGQYLPTNQGFDYFYGSHHINDNTPYYHVEERGGNYTVTTGVDIDQSDNSKLIHEKTVSWVENQVNENPDQPFFAYYASPWPHAPVHAGYEFQGKSGAGIYGDCLMEFDYYLGQLFDKLEELNVMDDTIIMFSSDNGPALQGSVNELRGGKYTAYEAGQKVPFYMKWNNAPAGYGMSGGRTIEAPAALADIFPTLSQMCGVTDGQKIGYLPSDVDREIDGVSMIPLLEDRRNEVFIHDIDHPILHMKREKIKAIQYSWTREEVLASVEGYRQSGDHKLQTGNAQDYAELPFIKNNEYLTWKYFKSMNNDNPAFPDKSRKNWLICLTDDSGESYQRADVFPTIAETMKRVTDDWTNKFHQNRRGIYQNYYDKK